MMDAKQTAAQLRCPHGEQAADVGKRMSEANAGINRKTIALLNLTSGDNVLEIGPGNGAFASEVVHSVGCGTYTGLDWSADMTVEAKKLNGELVAAGRATFLQGSSERLPFPDATFDKVFTINTIYFWEHPQRHLAEISRVLKPDGLFCLSFGERDFMRDLPFVDYGFTLYDNTKAEALLHASGLRVLNTHRYDETGHSNSGDVIDKVFLILQCGRAV